MPRLRRPALAVAIPVALLLIGCGSNDNSSSNNNNNKNTTAPATEPSVYPLTIDNCGEQVTLGKRPERIFTSGTTPVNLLVGVGAADRIVGRSGEFGQALVESVGKAVAKVPVVTPDRPTAELVIGSGADLYFSDPPNLSTLRPQLAAAGVKSLSTCNPNSFDKVWASLGLLGRMMGTEGQSRTVVESLQKRLEAVQAARPGHDRSAAVVSVFQNTLYTDGNATLKHSMLGVLGLRNVFADQNQQTFEANVEALIKANPDVIVLAYGSNNETFEDARRILAATPGAGRIKAIRDDAIVGIPFTLSYGSPLALDGLEGLAKDLKNKQ